jgi:hypothetical protein
MHEVPPESPKETGPPKPRYHPHAVHTSAIGFGILFLLVLLNWAAIHFGWIKVPPNTIPWETPHLDSRPGLFAHWQMQHIKKDRQMCLTALDNARDFSYTALADESTGSGCGFTDVVRATKSPIAFNIAPVTTCSLSAALYWWQRDIQRLSRQILHTKIRRIDQLGTYACRNINGAATGNRSEHATADAIDIEGFETQDGRRITVKDDWLKPTAEGRFLRAAHDSACGVFGEVLGPDYNSLHANHFHLDEAAWTICR